LNLLLLGFAVLALAFMLGLEFSCDRRLCSTFACSCRSAVRLRSRRLHATRPMHAHRHRQAQRLPVYRRAHHRLSRRLHPLHRIFSIYFRTPRPTPTSRLPQIRTAPSPESRKPLPTFLNGPWSSPFRVRRFLRFSFSWVCFFLGFSSSYSATPTGATLRGFCPFLLPRLRRPKRVAACL
jgi:hypothetical protein